MKNFLEHALLIAMGIMVIFIVALAMTIDTAPAWFTTLAVIGIVGALIYTTWRKNR